MILKVTASATQVVYTKYMIIATVSLLCNETTALKKEKNRDNLKATTIIYTYNDHSVLYRFNSMHLTWNSHWGKTKDLMHPMAG